MGRRSILVATGWVATAAIATLIGLGAIRLVGESLTGTPGGVRSEAEIERALASPEPAPTGRAPPRPAGHHRHRLGRAGLCTERQLRGSPGVRHRRRHGRRRVRRRRRTPRLLGARAGLPGARRGPGPGRRRRGHVPGGGPGVRVEGALHRLGAGGRRRRLTPGSNRGVCRGGSPALQGVHQPAEGRASSLKIAEAQAGSVHGLPAVSVGAFQ